MRMIEELTLKNLTNCIVEGISLDGRKIPIRINLLNTKRVIIINKDLLHIICTDKKWPIKINLKAKIIDYLFDFHLQKILDEGQVPEWACINRKGFFSDSIHSNLLKKTKIYNSADFINNLKKWNNLLKKEIIDREEYENLAIFFESKKVHASDFMGIN